MILLYILIFFFGAAWASFINATLYRIENHFKYPDIFTKSSHCEKCGKSLNWKELFPVFGYIFLGGKCPTCNTHIPIYYPISEFLLGLTFVLAYIYSFPVQFVFLIIFLFVLSYFDNLYMAVSKKLVHIFLLSCILIFFLDINFTNIIAPLSISIIFLLVNLFKKSFGFGDILILFGLGMISSYKQFLITFWIGILLALLYSLVMIVLKKKSIKNSKVPMIPFFAIAFVISIPYTEALWNMLLNFIGI